MANFLEAATKTLNLEGGYQTLKNDSGNYNSKKQLVGTNKGISAPTYEAWIKRVPTAADMKAITKDTALKIYKTWYWQPIKGDDLKDQQLANFLFDYAIHGGAGDAVKGLAKSWNKVFNPSFAESKTLPVKLVTAINSLTPERTNKLFSTVKEQRIYDIRTQGGTTYDEALIKRVNKFAYKVLDTIKDAAQSSGSKLLISGAILFFLYKVFISK